MYSAIISVKQLRYITKMTSLSLSTIIICFSCDVNLIIIRLDADHRKVNTQTPPSNIGSLRVQTPPF